MRSCFTASAAIFSSSSSGSKAPVGLVGKLSMITLVRGVIAFSTSLARSTKSSSGRVWIGTGTPPAIKMLGL
jgi:hypothetical protein